MERRKFVTNSLKYTALTFIGTSMLNNKLFASGSVLTGQPALSLKNYNGFDIVPNYPGVTTTVKLKGKDVKVHAVCTGKVAVKRIS